MDKQEELMGIERSLWTNDAAIYEATYSPDAILIFPEVGRIGLEHALEAIRAENAAGRHWAEVGFAGVSATRIALMWSFSLTRRQRAGRNPFHAGHGFRGCAGSLLLRPVRLLAPLYESDRSPGHRRLLLPGFRRVGHPSRR